MTDAERLDDALEQLEPVNPSAAINARRVVDRLRAEVDALADALADIAGMRPLSTGEQAVWVADAECSDLSGVPCHALDPDTPENWCPVCVAEVAWCAWKIGSLG